MTRDDLGGVYKVQLQAYASHPEWIEPISSFREMLNVYPSGCFVCRAQLSSDIAKEDIIGYVCSLPLEKNIYSVATLLESHPLFASPTATCLFIHDMAVLPEFQGNGLGTRMFFALKNDPKTSRLEEFRLMSVQKSRVFWHKYCGFNRASKEDKPENQWAINLIGYDDDAIPMSRKP